MQPLIDLLQDRKSYGVMILSWILAALLGFNIITVEQISAATTEAQGNGQLMNSLYLALFGAYVGAKKSSDKKVVKAIKGE